MSNVINFLQKKSPGTLTSVQQRSTTVRRPSYQNVVTTSARTAHQWPKGALMPAGYTHMTLSKMATNYLTTEVGTDAKFLLKKEMGPYLLGCVGPDLPYMGLFDDLKISSEHDHIADQLHTQHTIDIPVNGLILARQYAEGGNLPLARSVYAFYVGYLSHVIADGFTHPFIRDRVGDYGPKTKVAHRKLEVELDVLVLDHFLGVEANDISPQKDLTFFDNCAFKNEIFESYSKLLKDFHNMDLTAEQLSGLAKGMITALNLAEGNVKWYSLGMGKIGLAYLDLDDAKKREKEIRTLCKAIDADEKGIIYNSLGLEEIDVINDIFPKYFAYMPKVIEATYDFVFNTGADFTHLVPPINLDTGRLLTSTTLTDKPYFWEIV
jgi:hypothetical protein